MIEFRQNGHYGICCTIHGVTDYTDYSATLKVKRDVNGVTMFTLDGTLYPEEDKAVFDISSSLNNIPARTYYFEIYLEKDEENYPLIDGDYVIIGSLME